MVTTGIIALVLIILDQLTKYLTQVYTPNSVDIIPNFLTFDLVYNRGAAWGFLSDSTWLLAIISLVASIALGYLCTKNDWKNLKIPSLAVTFAFAGCVGNLIDRTMASIPFLAYYRPGVVDMISFEPLNAIARLFGSSGFPTFNLADAFLVVGLLIYSLEILVFAERRKKKEALQTVTEEETLGDIHEENNN